MADNTKIEWSDATWNIITGCSVVSAGCKNCYAMKLAGTRLRHLPSRTGLTRDTKAGPVWNGQVRFNEEWLDQPLRWARPRMIFVCAHGDLFHDAVPDAWIDKVFAIMRHAQQHIFQVLTKHPGRMRKYLTTNNRGTYWAAAANELGLEPREGGDRYFAVPGQAVGGSYVPDPLPNVWLGTSVENQSVADERIPELLATPAALRWLSCEPLLEPVSFRWAKWHDYSSRAPGFTHGHLDGMRGIGWVAVGGESGPGARPMVLGWAKDIVRQCQSAGVPVMMKQIGANPTNREGQPHAISDRKGAIMAEWPEILRVREFPR